MKARILWIEGTKAESPYFVPDLRKKGFLVDTVSTGRAALVQLSDFGADFVIIDAASFRTSGLRICKEIREEWPKIPILMIANPEKAPRKNDYADVVLVLPFTPRKLINRITPLLPNASSNILRAGPINLDLEQRRVRCHDKEAHLTPRLIMLLKAFMERPNEVLLREDLFREIWNTEYTGDTRTLDVHISWIRQAIEPDQRRPRYLKTIRSVGYRLDI